MGDLFIIGLFAVLAAALFYFSKSNKPSSDSRNKNSHDEDMLERPFYRHNKNYTLRNKHAAVTIAHEPGACDSVKALGNVRFLVRDAPLLPVKGCTKSKACDCQYLHHTDRRKIDRRTGIKSATQEVDDHRTRDRRSEDHYNIA